jgi:hypothetical protein
MSNDRPAGSIALVLVLIGLITVSLAYKAWIREHRVGVEHSFYEEQDGAA